jgi:hypothetical protein
MCSLKLDVASLAHLNQLETELLFIQQICQQSRPFSRII